MSYNRLKTYLDDKGDSLKGLGQDLKILYANFIDKTKNEYTSLAENLRDFYNNLCLDSLLVPAYANLYEPNDWKEIPIFFSKKKNPAHSRPKSSQQKREMIMEKRRKKGKLVEGEKKGRWTGNNNIW